MAPVSLSDLAIDNKDRQKKPRHRHTPAQLAALNELFDRKEHPSLEERSSLAGQLGMETKTVNAWFQNKRASSKKRNRGAASYELPSISTILGSSLKTPRHPELDEYGDDDSDQPPSLSADNLHQQTFYAGNPNHKHFFADTDIMPRRMRMRPSPEQTEELRKLYNYNPHPTKEEREELGERIGMRYQSITNWFQNQRSLAKKRKEDEAEAAASASDLNHEPRTFSAFPPASKHPSLALLPPSSSHPSLSLPAPKRSPSISAPPSINTTHSVPPSPRRLTPRRSVTPYGSATSALSRPRRTRPEPYQLDALRKLFKRTPTPSIEERSALAHEIGMDIGKVTNWFRNLRQTARKRAQKNTEEDGEHDGDSFRSASHYLYNESASVSRVGTPSLRSSSSSSSTREVDEHMDIDGDDYDGQSEAGSEDEYQEAVTPPPEPSPSPPPSEIVSAPRSRNAKMDVLGMVVDSIDIEKSKAATFSGVKIEDALLLLSFHKHVVH